MLPPLQVRGSPHCFGCWFRHVRLLVAIQITVKLNMEIAMMMMMMMMTMMMMTMMMVMVCHGCDEVKHCD